MIILTESQVEEAMNMQEAISINAQAFADNAAGKAVVPERIVISTPGEGVSLFKPAQAGDALGLKVVSVRAKNAEKGLPTVPAVMMMMDKETGLPNALLGATYLTALRTAAGSGVATGLFARPNSKVCTVFGAGMQAQEHIKAVICARPTIEKVIIVNRSLARPTALVEKLSVVFSCVSFEIVVTGGDAADAKALDDAVRQADVICMTTNSSTPLFDGQLVKDGTHINGIGSYTPAMQELDSKLVARSRIVVDSDHALPVGDLSKPIEEGLMKAEDVIGELGSFVQQEASSDSDGNSDGDDTKSKKINLDPKLVRTSDADITFFKSVGTAIQDIATAYQVVEKAKELNIGTQINLL